MNAWTLLDTFTFPGWPEVPEPSLWHLFLICILGPLLLGALVTAFFLGGSRRHAVAQEEAAVGLVDDPDRPALRRAQPSRAVEGAPARAVDTDARHDELEVDPEPGRRGGATAADQFRH
ncbi:hypothetical protein [Luteococcus peritonei]|uniref:Uncharacterized protein n=1 Tax=Luteococcus peritonei TaxID=88874 RepID=A0ABW4RXW5_9ACTN